MCKNNNDADDQRKSDNIEAGCGDYDQASDRDSSSYPDDDQAAKNADKEYGK